MYPIRPSALPQLMHCAGAWLLQAMHPEPDGLINQPAADGTAAHEVAAEIARALKSPQGTPRDPMAYVGHVASNGATLDRSLCEAVAEYMRDVLGVLHTYGDAQALHVEEPIEIIPDVLGGTPDLWYFSARANVLTVWDFKTGHDPIEAFENWQLLAYLQGILQKLGINGLADQYLKVELRIVQPRAPHRLGTVRKWGFIASEARGYFNRIADRCRDILTSDAPRTKAGTQCLYCSARANCDTAQRAGAAAIEFVGAATSIPFDPAGASYELALLDRMIEAAKTRRSGLVQAVETAIRSGQPVAEFVLEPKYGRDVWAVPDADLYVIGDSLGVDLRNTKPITPTQAKSAGLPPDLVDNLRESKQSGFQLVRADQSLARQVFTQHKDL